jgi:curved DNA-binding protein CbpA
MEEDNKIQTLKEILRLSFEYCEDDNPKIAEEFSKINLAAYQLLKNIEHKKFKIE